MTVFKDRDGGGKRAIGGTHCPTSSLQIVQENPPKWRKRIWLGVNGLRGIVRERGLTELESKRGLSACSQTAEKCVFTLGSHKWTGIPLKQTGLEWATAKHRTEGADHLEKREQINVGAAAHI